MTRVAILAVILGAAGAAYGIEESTQPDSLQSIDTNIRSVYLDATKQAAFGSPALRLVSHMMECVLFARRNNHFGIALKVNYIKRVLS